MHRISSPAAMPSCGAFTATLSFPGPQSPPYSRAAWMLLWVFWGPIHKKDLLYSLPKQYCKASGRFIKAQTPTYCCRLPGRTPPSAGHHACSHIAHSTTKNISLSEERPQHPDVKCLRRKVLNTQHYCTDHNPGARAKPERFVPLLLVDTDLNSAWAAAVPAPAPQCSSCSHLLFCHL